MRAREGLLMGWCGFLNFHLMENFWLQISPTNLRCFLVAAWVGGGKRVLLSFVAFVAVGNFCGTSGVTLGSQH